ncbi:MAG: hypothetical protein JW885_13860 [Deltaproteobacteria bacterium]|nr:hypothetical protein [Candidatus Zymogenaceae bacterium]
MTEKLIISIDGGGTKTVAVAVTTEGKAVGWGESGPGNHVLAPIEVVKESLRSAVAQAVTDAHAAMDDVLIIAGDTAGVGHNREGAVYVEGLIGEYYPETPIHITGDMVAGFLGALPQAEETGGVVATAGTGSSIYGRNPSGEGLQVGGWGHIMGDEGSGYDIAVMGLRAAAKAFDGRGKPTSLTEAFPPHFGVGDMFLVQVPVYIGEILTHEEIEEGTAEEVNYGSGLSRERISKAATIVAQEAEKGDAVARDVMARAAEELALAVVTVARRLGMTRPDLLVSYAGGVFKAGDVLLEPFGACIIREYPDAKIVPPRLPVVGGGVKIAADELGLDFSKMLPRLTEELRRM